MNKPESIKKISFEDALTELEEIVRKIDTGQENLADAIDSFERGVLLKKHCEQMLKDAKLKIEKIASSSEGKINTTEVDL